MRLNPPEHFVAIDWSGSATLAGQRRHIVVAWSHQGEVTLQSGMTRQEVVELLITAGKLNPRMVVGLDFAFSFPAWWVRAQGCGDVFALWALAAQRGEQWLHQGQAPFWGRPGQTRPGDHGAPHWLGFRGADRSLEIAVGSVRPKSPFQIGGAGAVGTGSVRGMPMLSRLHACGFHFWPFEVPAWPLVLEIYPRLFTGPIVKSDGRARAAYLQRPQFSRLSRETLEVAAASEDAFDALCSVLGMAEHPEGFTALRQGDSPALLLEGAIWRP